MNRISIEKIEVFTRLPYLHVSDGFVSGKAPHAKAYAEIAVGDGS